MKNLLALFVVVVSFSAESLIYYPDRLWPKADKQNSTQINIVIYGDSGFDEQVKYYARKWTKYANIDFNFFDNDKERRKFNSKTNHDVNVCVKESSWAGVSGVSSVGWPVGAVEFDFGDCNMSLKLSHSADPSMIYEVIVHEFGHLLGLQHEHLHKDRTFHVNTDKALQKCREDGWDDTDYCFKSEYKIIDSRGLGFFPYDRESIMNYPINADLITKAKNPAYLYNFVGRGLSLHDKLGISKLYPGRINPQQIKKEHFEFQRSIQLVENINNCSIKEKINSQGNTVYYFYSPHHRRFSLPQTSKEMLILNARHSLYCQK